LEVSDYFDELYRRPGRYWWHEDNRYAGSPGAYPQSLLTRETLRLIQGRSRLRVLDLGAGEGADSIRLALLGHEVDAVELSEEAAKKIQMYADEAQAAVNVETCDITRYKPAHAYDVVICNGVLHYIEDKPSVLEMMQEATSAGGIDIISLWSTHSPVPRFHNRIPAFCDHEDGVVIRSYGRWATEIKRFERDKPEKSHTDMPPHAHSHIKLIVRKPPARAAQHVTQGAAAMRRRG